MKMRGDNSDPPAASDEGFYPPEGNDREYTHTTYSSSLSSSAAPPVPLLPRMITVTVPKRPDQPAGLTLQFRHPPDAVPTTKTQKRLRKKNARSNNKSGGSEVSGGSSSESSRRRGQQKVGSSVVVASVSARSPFHPDNILTLATASDASGTNSKDNDNNNINISNNTLQVGDEILTINGHRVKDPRRAAQMIKSTTSGHLTIVASRGRETMGIEGTVYHLARLGCGPHAAVADGGGKREDNAAELVDRLVHRGELRSRGGGDAAGHNRCGVTFRTCHRTGDCSLARVSSVTSDSCPFVKTGLRVGDVVLSVNGMPVRTAEDAERLLRDGHGPKNRIHMNEEGSSQVVALLVYSFWEMWRRLLREELQLDTEDVAGDKPMWELFWSHERGESPKEESGLSIKSGEFVMLRIPDTTVTFKLDFDDDGTCSCAEPHAALNAFPENHDGRRGWRKLEHSYSFVVGEDDESSHSDSRSRLSKDEARAALDLLFQKHVQPAVDSLNYHTWRQVRLLASALTRKDDRGLESRGGVGAWDGLVPDLSPPAVQMTQCAIQERSPLTKIDQVRLLAHAFAENDDGGEDRVIERGNARECCRAYSPPPAAVGSELTRAEREHGPTAISQRSPQPYQSATYHGVREMLVAQVGIREGRASSPLANKSGADGRGASGRSLQPHRPGKVHAAKKNGTERKVVRDEAWELRAISPPADDNFDTMWAKEHHRAITGGRRPPQLHQVEKVHNTNVEGRQRKATPRRRSPQPNESESLEFRRRRRTPRPYQMEKAQMSAMKTMEETAEDEGELDNFQDQLGKVQLHTRRESAKIVLRQNRNEDSSDSPTSNPAPYHVSKSNDADQGKEEPNTRLWRRPSSLLAPGGFRSKRVSMTELSAISSESESSKSRTSTTSSDDSSSYTDSKSSDDGSDRSRTHPAQVRTPRRGERRRSAMTGGLSDSMELVVYRGEGQKQASDEPSKQLSKHVNRNMPRLKMRNGDIRTMYKVLPHIIGKGAFGTVRSCIHRRTNERLAVKSIAKNGHVVKSNTKLLKNEIALVQRVNHPNVVRVSDVIQDREYIHIVMEECKGGDLFDKIVDGGVQLGERRACEIITSLLGAIAYLHKRHIVHRDLKVRVHIMRQGTAFFPVCCTLSSLTTLIPFFVFITSFCCVRRRSTSCFPIAISTPHP